MKTVLSSNTSAEGAVKPKSFYSGDNKKSSGTLHHYLTPLQRKKIRELKNITLENKLLQDDLTPIKENLMQSKIETKNGNPTNRKLHLKSISGLAGINKCGPIASTPKKNDGKVGRVKKSRTFSWAPSSLGKRFLKANRNFKGMKILTPKSSDDSDKLNKSLPPRLSPSLPPLKRSSPDSENSVELSSFTAEFCVNGSTDSDPSPPSKMRKIDEEVSPDRSSSSLEENVALPQMSQSLPIQPQEESVESPIKQSKLYPIFNKMATPKSSSTIMKKLKSSNTDENTVSPITPKNLVLKVPRTPKMRSALKNGKEEQSPDVKQMIIDAGQKRFGAMQCGMCGMMYSANHPSDEQQHVVYHKRFLNLLKFSGWKKERVVSSFMNGRIVKVMPSDPKYAVKKVEDILTIVDIDLGFKVAHSGLSSSKIAYLFISDDEKIIGCLIAEKISQAYRLNPPEGNTDPDSSKENIICYTESTPAPVVCGVSRVWTYAPMRRKRIASRLLDALRSSFVLGMHLDLNQVAFSDPTPDGRAFATKYFNSPRVLVYNFIR